MNKQQFFYELNRLLAGLPEIEKQKAFSYYEEIIEDSIEDGCSEEEAIARLGNINEIAEGLISDFKSGNPIRIGKSSHSLGAVTTILLILGFPLWGSLMIALFSLVLAAIIVLFIPVIILGSIAISFFAAGVFAFVGSFVLMTQIFSMGIIQFGASLFLMGASVFAAFGLYYTTKGCVYATKKLMQKLGQLFKRRRG
jgi:Predicted membrane protein